MNKDKDNHCGTTESIQQTAQGRPVTLEANSALAIDSSEFPAIRSQSNSSPAEDPPLIRALRRESVRRGHRMTEMAASLGCTYGYVAQLRAGVRKPEHISQQFADRCSSYLGIPTAVTKLLAGQISERDFSWPNRSTEQDLAFGLESLRDDPAIGAFVPDALFKADQRVKEFVWRLYQESVGAEPRSLQVIPTALEYLQRAAKNQNKYEILFADLREEMNAKG